MTIIESTRQLWGHGEGWKLSGKPEVVVGLTEGEDGYILSEVRGVRRLSDGRVAILDGGSHRLRLYDSAGTHLMDLGGAMPAFRGITVDSEDNLWVGEWEGVGVKQGRFSVFRSDGAWLGHVELPDGLVATVGVPDVQTLEIGADYILGVWADELGVEQVRLYRIEKN